MLRYKAVEAIVARETFQDDELEKLSGLHTAFYSGCS